MTEEATLFLVGVVILWITFIPAFLMWMYDRRDR